MKRVFPLLGGLTAVLLSHALYQALVVAPTDQLQGDVYRIIYYHVPSAWTTFVFFTINFVASVIYLFRRSVRTDAVTGRVIADLKSGSFNMASGTLLDLKA